MNIIEEIKSRIRISDIIGKKVNLKKHNKGFLGLCPFHQERTPSFSVNDDKGFYHCFGCKAHGDVLNFLMQTENIAFAIALRQLAEMAGVHIPDKFELQEDNQLSKIYEINLQALNWFQRQLRLSHEVLQYCSKRGVTEELITKFSIGFAPKHVSLSSYLLNIGFSELDIINASLGWQNENGELLDSFYDRLMIPIFDLHNNVIGFGGRILGSNTNIAKYKNSAENLVFKKGNNVFNLNYIKKQGLKEIIVVEGYLDVISLAGAGFDNAVAAMGTAFTENQLRLLWRYAKTPLFCFDGDTAGIKAMERALHLVLEHMDKDHSANFIILPKGYDPDDLIRSGKKDLFNKLIAKPMDIVKTIWSVSGGSLTKSTYIENEVNAIQQAVDANLALVKNKEIKWNLSYYFRRKIWDAKKNIEKSEKNVHFEYGSQVSESDNILATILVYLSKNSELLEQNIDFISGINTNNELIADIIHDLINFNLSEEKIGCLFKTPYNVIYNDLQQRELELYISIAINKYLFNSLDLERKKISKEYEKFTLLTNELNILMQQRIKLEKEFSELRMQTSDN